MRAVITRVKSASVTIDGEVTGRIGKGFLVLLGVCTEDGEAEAERIADRICGLRVFEDGNGKMNVSPADAGAEMLIVSQFTLFASTRRGNRPSYIRSAPEAVSRPVYERFVESVRSSFGGKVATGVFGADMKVELVNDGPVTIWIDSRNRE